MSTPAQGGASVVQQMTPIAAADVPRVKVEQASYAYAATDRSAPKFSLGPASFEARQRELVAILGPNASGKSTLLTLLAGLAKPLSGRIEIDGTEVSKLDLKTRAQRIALCSRKASCCFPCAFGSTSCRGGIRMGGGCGSSRTKIACSPEMHWLRSARTRSAIAGWSSYRAARSNA